MKFFEVFVELLSISGRSIGRTMLHIEAVSRFDAAVKAEKAVDASYQGNIISHTVRVHPISRSEYLFDAA